MAMQTPSIDGLIGARDGQRRWTTVPIYNATEYEPVGLERLWSSRSASMALEVLRQPDVTATNQSDKHVQLGKLEGLDARVREQMIGSA